jgi:D-alanyl-D-alanine carboxypeptidase/D-alanyl-D-alanine-endopeptidase (penicillin-binding protein 4)
MHEMMRFWGMALVAATAVAVTGVATARAADVQAQARGIVQAADLRDTRYGLMAVDVETGKALIRINADEPMVPASNMKLLTTAAAVALLGEDFVFRTELSLITEADLNALPPAAADTRKNNKGPILLVKADGDPGFGDPELLAMHGLEFDQLVQTWVQHVKQTGLTQIERLIIDDRVFDQEFVHPSWPANQLNNWYCAQVSGLIFFDNCLAVYPKPTSPGQAPLVRLYPSVPFISVQSRAVTGKGDTFWVSRKTGTNEMTLWGKVQNERTEPVFVTIHDPPMVFGRLLAHELGQAGITVQNVSRPRPEDQLPAGTVLHLVQTTLPMVLQRCNKDSQNLFAEALFKRMGRKVTGAPGSFINGAAAVRRFLRDQLGGARGAEVDIADGSGMSRDNRVTARLLVDLLASMHEKPSYREIFRPSLSVGGKDGTLRMRYRTSDGRSTLNGTVYGKSGYINEVSSLSGYLVVPVQTGAGPTAAAPGSTSAAKADAPARVVAFSFLFNGFKAPLSNADFKKVQDNLLKLLDEEMSRQATATPMLGG